LYRSGDPSRIEEYLRQYLYEMESTGRKLSGEYASVLNELASFYRGVSRYEESAAAFKQALELLRYIGLDKTPQDATILLNFAGLFRLKGQPHEAVEMFLDARNLLITSGMQNDYAYRSVLNNLALAYQDIGRYEDAYAAAYESYEGMCKTEASEHEIATALNNLAVIRLKMGNDAEAQILIDEALVYYDKMPEENVHHAAALSTKGSLLFRSGQHREALASFQKSLELTERFFGKNIEYAIAARNIAKTYEALDDLLPARNYILSAKTVFEQILGSDHPRTKECCSAAEQLSRKESEG
jgi:tetratricopeptide (TPR) repeat protein